IDPTTPPNASVLMQGYQLTNAEARLACELTKGGGHDELASRMGLSPNTIKSQLAAVFSKTGTTSQSEVVALLKTLPR
ncbi:helix-turn-helix transcriptional regulator, partial [Acinetobacter baumannii]